MTHLLDTTSPIPLHYQVAQRLKYLIREGALVPGEAIPPERELCEQYAVSRPTVRQAIQALVNDGLLERRRGVGTFVALPKVRQPLSSVLGFSERIEREGRVPATRLLEKTVMTAAQAGVEVTDGLRVAPTAPILRVIRLRLVDDEPHLLQTSHLPLDRFPGLDTLDLETSLYRILRTRYNLAITYITQTLEPVLVKSTEAKWLGIKPNQPAMLITATTHDQTDQPFEYALTLARSDRCQHYLEFRFGSQGQTQSMVLRQTHLEVVM